jgi:hypothetical protein
MRYTLEEIQGMFELMGISFSISFLESRMKEYCEEKNNLNKCEHEWVEGNHNVSRCKKCLKYSC